MSGKEPTVADRFDAFLSSLEPPLERVARAKALPALLRTHIETSPKVRLVEPGTLLVGSYRRETAIFRIKDVDLAVFVDPSYATQPVSAVMNDLFKSVDEFSRKERRSINRSPQRRSIRVEFVRDSLQMDVVPLVAARGDPYGDLWIPDRDWKRWVPTRSVGYLRWFSAFNKKHGDRVVPLVKLFKAWRLCAAIERRQLKSFWLELMLVQEVQDGNIMLGGRSWDEVVLMSFDALVRRCAAAFRSPSGHPTVRDPMIPGADAAALWTRAGFESFFPKVVAARGAAMQAQQARTELAAGSRWRTVFGSKFAPSPLDWLI